MAATHESMKTPHSQMVIHGAFTASFGEWPIKTHAKTLLCLFMLALTTSLTTSHTTSLVSNLVTNCCSFLVQLALAAYLQYSDMA